MVEDDTAYYRQRAVTERAMARSASRKEVATIHEELARQYQALADQLGLRPERRVDPLDTSDITG